MAALPIKRDAVLGILSVRAVVDGGFCVGCGACSFASQDAIRMHRNELGICEADIGQSSPEALDAPSSLCPFSDAAENEDSLSQRFAPTVAHYDRRLGYYSMLAAGRISDLSEIASSRSGGMTSWLLEKLLDAGLIDGVLHVGSADGGSGSLFRYAVSNSAADPRALRKSIYSSNELSEELYSIAGDRSEENTSELQSIIH